MIFWVVLAVVAVTGYFYVKSAEKDKREAEERTRREAIERAQREADAARLARMSSDERLRHTLTAPGARITLDRN